MMCHNWTITDLRETHPAAFERAYREFVDFETQLWECEDGGYGWESLEALTDHVGASWAHRGSYRSHIVGLGDAAELSGPRALAWLENVVLGPLRIPWTPIAASPQRRQFAHYGRHYTPGMVTPCPLTGIYTDEAILNALRESIMSRGATVADAFGWLPSVAESLTLAELDDRTSEAAFIESCAANGYQFCCCGSLGDCA